MFRAAAAAEQLSLFITFNRRTSTGQGFTQHVLMLSYHIFAEVWLFYAWLITLLIKPSSNQTSVRTVYVPKAAQMHKRRTLTSHSSALFTKVLIDGAVYRLILKLFSNGSQQHHNN